MSCSLVRCAIIPSALTRPRRPAAKSGADTRFSGPTLSDGAHPPATNAMAAIPARNGFDLLTIALRLDGASGDVFVGMVESQVGMNGGAPRCRVGAQQIRDRVDDEEPVRARPRRGGRSAAGERICPVAHVARLADHVPGLVPERQSACTAG